jgi:hypothetical protein
MAKYQRKLSMASIMKIMAKANGNMAVNGNGKSNNEIMSK